MVISELVCRLGVFGVFCLPNQHLLTCRGRQIGLIDKRVPPRPLAAGGRLTLNRLTRGAERR